MVSMEEEKRRRRGGEEEKRRGEEEKECRGIADHITRMVEFLICGYEYGCHTHVKDCCR